MNNGSLMKDMKFYKFLIIFTENLELNLLGNIER